MYASNGFNSALSGVRAGMQSMQKHASDIAGTVDVQVKNQPSLAESLVGLKMSKLQVQASMQVIKTLDEVIGTLLDVRA
ncbi:MAG TPA: flagellar biosynthesis protein FlgE [Gammaproteobacteria bacterium]|nr:flagellar biosynthesis protein FlgE [Gammaproteobacteria bacterium]